MQDDLVPSVTLDARLLGELVTMAREMATDSDVEQTLDMLLPRIQQAFLCDAVGILLVEDGAVTTAAATGVDVARADELQMECGEGPCLEAIRTRQDFVAHDLRMDERWPRWGPKAAELGWRSILSLDLAEGRGAFGALNLYSRQTSFFTAGDVGLGEVFSAQAALALSSARNRRRLQQAVESRHLIGQAQGILMERYEIDADQAFTVLRRYSSHLNRKLRVVAEDVVERRRLPKG